MKLPVNFLIVLFRNEKGTGVIFPIFESRKNSEVPEMAEPIGDTQHAPPTHKDLVEASRTQK